MALESYRRQRVISKSANADFGQIIMLNAGDVDGRIVRFEAAKGNGRANTACKLWIDKGEGLAVFCELIRVDMPTPTWEAAIPVRGLDVGMYDAAIRLEDVDGSITETMPLRVQVVGSILAESEATEEMQDALDDFEIRTNAALADIAEAITDAETATTDAQTATTEATEAAQDANTAAQNIGASVDAQGILTVTDADGTSTTYSGAATAAQSATSAATRANAAAVSAETAAGNIGAEVDSSGVVTVTDADGTQTTYNGLADAVLLAHGAAERADDAAIGANAAKDSANSAALSANSAATSATSAAGTATGAAETATSAASSANTAATAATSAANAANSAANSATSAASSANSAATSANNAATAANTAATNAGTATTNAEAATTAANEAAESATDAATAASDAADDATDAAAAANTAAEQVAPTIADVQSILETYNEKDVYLTGTFLPGYINNSGEFTENAATLYASMEITDDLIGKKLYISGSAWWAIKPFVFVGDSTNIVIADVQNPGGTVTQYTDLEFIPDETGTLYINKYDSGSMHNIGSVFYNEIDSVKNEYLKKISITDTICYYPLSLVMNNNKSLNASTGVISDDELAIYRVSDFTEVESESNILLSTQNFWSQGMYAFYDENKIFIPGSGRSAASGGTVTILRNEIIVVPEDAKYIVIGFLYTQNYTSPSLLQGIKQGAKPSQIWAGKKWVTIGDSISASYGVTDVHYWEFIKAATGITVTNLSVSGTGYARGNNNFMAQTSSIPNDTDIVTIFGSGNDAGAELELGTWSDTGTATIAGCVNTAIDNVFSVNPIMPLGIITPTPWSGNTPSDNGYMERYSNLLVEICKKRSIPCLDLFHCSNLNPNSAAVREAAYSKDNGGGIHPDEAGHLIIATHVKAFLQSLLL